MTNTYFRLRILTLSFEARTEVIREVARADVVDDFLRSWRMEPVMSGHHDPAHPRPRPFVGERLSSAVWDPIPPDALVMATPDVTVAIPDEIASDLPRIIVLRAWARMMPIIPSRLLDMCWRRTIDGQRSHALHDDVQVTCAMLRVLLDRSSPAELAALSRPGR